MATVARYFDRSEALVAASLLEAEGIPARLADEQMTQIAWIYTLALGGVRLEVPDDRLEEAQALLAASDARIAGKIEEVGKDVCARCGSEAVDFKRFDRRIRGASMLLMWLGVPALMWSRKRFRCRECGHRWNEAPRPSVE